MPETARDDFNWDYPPPPTVYDSVRDSFLLKTARLGAHRLMRPFLARYNHLQVSGACHVLANWPCIIAPNHSSHLDTIAVMAALPLDRVNRTCVLAAKDYFFANPLVAFGARLMANVIPIDRVNTERRGLFICLDKLREGKNILMFPEGTRGAGPGLGRFKEGAILLSRKAGTPIIPTYIRGTREAMPRRGRLPHPHRITVTFGEPVRYSDAEYMGLDGSQAALDLETRVGRLAMATGGKI